MLKFARRMPRRWIGALTASLALVAAFAMPPSARANPRDHSPRCSVSVAPQLPIPSVVQLPCRSSALDSGWTPTTDLFPASGLAASLPTEGETAVQDALDPPVCLPVLPSDNRCEAWSAQYNNPGG